MNRVEQMNCKNVILLYKKELQGAIRDRRTLISMIIIPLIFYPLLFLGIGYFSIIGQKNSEIQPSTINIFGTKNAPLLMQLLENDKKLIIIKSDTISDQSLENEPLGIGENVDIEIYLPENIDNVFQINDDNDPETVILQYDSTSQNSLTAKKRITVLMDEYKKTLIKIRLQQMGLNTNFLEPFQEEWLDIAADEKKIGFLLGSILPYLIIILIFIGAMHSAVDITAGEKERGTLATLLVSQLNRIEIVLGKYLTVMTISAISMLLGLLGLGIAFLVPVFILGEISIIGIHFSFSLFFFFFLILVPLVGLASAILVLIGIFARNSREASTYITPIYMVAIFLGMISLSQGIELSKLLFFIPILNNSFVFKELLMGIVDWYHICGTLFSNISVALLALWGAAKLFNKENIIFRS